jgi:hypothetical protein
VSEPIAITPAFLLAAIYADLSHWASAQRGRVYVAKDLEHAVLLLADNPAGFTVVLHWQGDDPAGSGTRRSSVVEHNLRVFLRANLGPTAEPDIALIRATAARPSPFLELLSEVRRRMLAYRIPGVRAPGDLLSYKGCTDQASVGGYLIAVYSLLFGVYAPIDMPTEEEHVFLNLNPA